MTRASIHHAIRTGALALLIVLAGTSAFAESVRVTVDRARIWGTPTGTGGIIGIATLGDILEVEGREGRWLLVVLPADPRRRGYVLEQQTEPVDGAVPAARGAGQPARPGASQRGPVRPAARQPRAFLFVGVTGQATPLDFDGTDSIQTLLESETRTTSYRPSKRPGLELTIGGEVRRNLVIEGSVVQMMGPGKADISAQIPHPIFYSQPRTLEGQVDADRTETAVHVNVGGMLHRGPGHQLVVSGGPSFFFVKQDLLDRLTYEENYPYDEVTFTSASVQRHSATAYGANVAVDFAKAISRRISWQVTFRFSHAWARFDVNDATVKSPAGRGQVSGGIRASF